MSWKCLSYLILFEHGFTWMFVPPGPQDNGLLFRGSLAYVEDPTYSSFYLYKLYTHDITHFHLPDGNGRQNVFVLTCNSKLYLFKTV